MSSEQVIKYQSYKKWSRLRAVLQTLYLLTVPTDTKFGYNYPCTVIKIFAFQVLEYMVLKTTHSEVLKFIVCCM